MMKLNRFFIIAAMAALTACHNDDPVVISAEREPVEGATPDTAGPVAGVYVMNEGNMGANKCTIDFFDYATAEYIRNLYPERNPNAVLELGDTGNDIAIDGNKLFIVVTGSNKVEILDAATCKSMGHVDIPSCRNIAFDDKGNAYVSSFVGGTGDCGSVVRFDTTTGTITGSVSVGLQPEEIVIADGKLYVANSGQFQAPNYDRTISVVSLDSFTMTGSIEVDVNMHHLRADNEGNLWVSSRGNYYDIPSNLYKLPKEGKAEFGSPIALDIPCTNFTISGDKLYYYATVYDESWNSTNIYGTVDTRTAAKGDDFITDGTQASIMAPYCVAVQPSNGDIFITDARNYVSSGELRCYSPEGTLKWTAKTGDIPGHIAFLMR
ncbi:MAG: YncE family protein [Bacteroidales bacterium]|nr:YncE family protein [Bacteroidales bacterium]